MAGTELGSAYISVGLGTNSLAGEIREAFGGAGGVGADAGDAAGRRFSGRFSGFMKSAALPAAGVLGGIGLMAKNFGELAATAEQNVGAVETVFGAASGQVQKFADKSANAVGLSSSSYNELSAITGTALKSAGVSVDELAGKNDALITRGADMASVFGGSTAEAVGAMGAAFRGEFDPLERYGLTLTAAQVSAELAARGQDNLGGAALEAAKKQATMDLIMQQSAGNAGNFAKEADTASGAQERSTAAWEDASAKLGEQLLPIMTDVATKVSEMATWISENSGLVTGLAIGVGVLAAAIGAWSVVQGILNLVMLASPVTWIVLGIIALIAAIVLLVMNWDAVVAFISQIWGGFVNWLIQIIDGFVVWWNQVWAAVGQFISDTWNNIVTWVTTAINNVWTTITSVVGNILAAWNQFWGDVGAKVSEIWESIKTGVSTGIDAVVTFVSELPDKVLGFFSNAGTLLLGAGGNIIQGFLDGLSAGFEDVKNFVGGIGTWIAENKGPKAYDLALLIPAGGWIMDGLEKGIEGSLPSLQKTLGGVSATIAGGLSAPSYSPSALVPAAGGAGAGVVMNVHPAPGMSEDTIGRIAANSLNYQLRMA